MSVISLDTECTGLDLAHGARPFLVTTCSKEGVIKFWEWDVNPITRCPEIPDSDITDIQSLIDSAEVIYLQNSKFDIKALSTIDITLPWSKVRDTLVMGHLLASNHRHDLTTMCMEYLEVDIGQYEDNVKSVVQSCRTIARRNFPNWRIAVEGSPDMPSVKGGSGRDEDKPWKNDMWLPRALARAHTDDCDPRWLDICAKYANADSEHTLFLGLQMEQLVRERGLWDIYTHRMELPRVACEMEEYGVTVIGEYTESTIQEYAEYSAEAAAALRDIASEYGHELTLAEGAALNDNMRDFFYGARHLVCDFCSYRKVLKHWNDAFEGAIEVCPKCLKGGRRKTAAHRPLRLEARDNLGLPVITGKKTGRATLDKEAMQEYLLSLDGTALEFIRILTDKRKRDTDLSYMEAYRRFWVQEPGVPGFYRIHPSLNPCGTDHLRWSSSNPNLQNVGKQEDMCDDCDGKGCDQCHGTGKKRTSVRYCFGPAPGREWWSMDFQNIELRIPAYESGEEAMIELFERPNEPPYFGSYHCLNASIVYPELFWPLADKEGAFKKRYKATEYQWAKNGGFALQYGCGERKADATFRRSGAYRLLKEKLPKIAALNQHYVRLAERTGWIYTLPDRAVDSRRGYPMLASRTDDNRVLSTTPFNYHVSGTACWCKNTALIRCSRQLAEWRREGFDAWMALEIHDEILFDFPKGSSMEENLPRALILKALMEESGRNLIPAIPTPVSVEYHDTTWAVAV